MIKMYVCMPLIQQPEGVNKHTNTRSVGFLFLLGTVAVLCTLLSDRDIVTTAFELKLESIQQQQTSNHVCV